MNLKKYRKNNLLTLNLFFIFFSQFFPICSASLKISSIIFLSLGFFSFAGFSHSLSQKLVPRVARLGMWKCADMRFAMIQGQAVFVMIC